LAKKLKYDIHDDFNIPMAMAINPMTIRLGPILPGLASFFTRPERGLSYRKERIRGHDGAMVPLEIATPSGIGSPAPCLVYFHGGAFILGGAPQNKNLVFRLAKTVPCKVVYVDYRLAGSHPFPAGVEDCYAALQWTAQNTAALGIDRQRIGVYGESAGGALAAAVAQMARDRGGPLPCLQMLIYPVTDCSMSTGSAQTFTDTPVWRTASNASMWGVYLRSSQAPYSPYASPMNAASLKDLPPAYVETAEFDPLRDEGIAYARRLETDGVEVTLIETQRTVHGFDMIGQNEIVQESLSRRTEVLRKYLLHQA
jgi:acetyl esterase